MPTYLTLGKLSQAGYDTMEQGPETVHTFIEKVTGMGGSFEEDDFYVLDGEYDWAAIIEFPSAEAAAAVSDVYARTGRGRIHDEVIVAQGPDGYEDFVQSVLDAE